MIELGSKIMKEVRNQSIVMGGIVAVEVFISKVNREVG